MRTVLLSILLVLALAPPPAAGQASEGGEHLLSDARGDVVFATGVPGAAPVPYAGAEADATDLLWLDVVESDETLDVVVALASMGQSAGFEITVEFEWRGVAHRVEMRRSNPTFGDFASASLWRASVEDEADFDFVSGLEMIVDPQAAVATAILPKVYVLDAQERAPNRDDTITNVRAFAEQRTMQISIFDSRPLSARDEMPDGDAAGADLTLQMGDFAAGHLRLTTEDRIRVSNGGATTFVFQATLANNASFEDEVDLALGDVPEGWNGTIQTPVKVPPNGERTIAVLASVPFEHEHGGYTSFNLTAKSRKDPGSTATVRLGVLHTPTAQPAGHHEELYLHGQNGNGGIFGTVFPFSSGYINTDSSHEGDVESVPRGYFINGGKDFTWWLPLNPSLRTGLDFDLNRTGEIAGVIMGRANVDVELTAKLHLYKMTEDGEPEGLLLAEADAVSAKFDLNAPTPFKLTLRPTADADYVPYAKDQNMVLQIVAKMDESAPPLLTVASVNEPSLQTADFKMTLPLNEYHDRLTGIAEAATSLDLRADGLVEKLARPGTTMTYAFELVNGAGRELRVSVDIAGNDARLGTLVPSGAVTLAPGETRRVTLAVRVPAEAAEGQQLEVLVFAYAQDDPGQMAIARTKTLVTLGSAALDDETEILVAAREAERDTPALPLVGALAAVLVAIAARRRR